MNARLLLVVCSFCAAACQRREATANGSPPKNPCSAANCLPIFYPGLNGSKCYRIPTIIRTHAGTLLAFAEQRLSGCGDQGRHNLVLRRSADDGQHWGPVITVFVGVTPCPGCPAAVSNPNPVEVSLPSGKRAVLLVFDTMNNPSGVQHGLDMALWSFDDGLTWGEARALDYAPEKNVGSLVGPTVGLQAADGTLFFWISAGFLIVSRDHGATWTPSQRAGGMHGECSIAFAADATNHTLIMNCREGKHGRRSQLYWNPSGDTYAAGKASQPVQLTDPGCQGSIINHEGVLFTSNAASTSARARLTIRRSGDAGASWSAKGLVLHEGPSAYSQLVGLGKSSGKTDGQILGVLFEAGRKNPYETISFAKFQAPVDAKFGGVDTAVIV
eukprot:TRINITY_DN20741_c0_g4_i1.p1 TRINITY_DN20741_c0_g4~~TRINITY_DN20741_c0_g4_i1.p1  ORF type:complete len:386 (-),score=69.94 TRINITY_DN20741_c0_g4_i1:125-1282(-)